MWGEATDDSALNRLDIHPHCITLEYDDNMDYIALPKIEVGRSLHIRPFLGSLG